MLLRKEDRASLYEENEVKRGYRDIDLAKREISKERRDGQFDMLSWLLRQYEYSKFTKSKKIKYEVKAGEIYEIDFGINVNAEFSYRHLGLVLVDSDEANPLALVCPLKSNYRGIHPESDINLGFIQGLDSDHETLAIVNQIRAIDKVRIYRTPIINQKRMYDESLNDVEYENEEALKENRYHKYRLDNEDFMKVRKGIENYMKYGTAN